MSLWIVLIAAVLLSLGAFFRGAWPLAAAAWVLFGLGALIGGDFGPFVIIAGAVLLLLGGASMTRGAIFDGSPKAELSERKPSIFKGDNYDLDVERDASEVTLARHLAASEMPGLNNRLSSPESNGLPIQRWCHGIAPGSIRPRNLVPITRSEPARRPTRNRSRSPRSYDWSASAMIT